MARPKKTDSVETVSDSSDTSVDKDVLKVLGTLDEVSPYATFLSESTLSTVSEWINTGSMALNAVISGKLNGGIPVGRLTMLAGESQCGKTFIVLKLIAEAQKMGKTVIVFDTENAIDPESAKSFGIDLTKLKYVPTFTIEECRNAIFSVLTAAKEKNLIGKLAIFIDSLGNLNSELEVKRMDKDNKAADMGSRAKATKSLLRTCTQLAALTHTAIVCTNHVYADPSAMFKSILKLQSGGSGVIYLPSVTVQMARSLQNEDKVKNIDDTDKLTAAQKTYSGVVLKAMTAKNRFIQPFLEVEMYLSFSKGLHKYYGLLDLAIQFGVLKTRGGVYDLWDGTPLGFAKKWRDDEQLWNEKILPKIQEAIDANWRYNSNEDPDDVFEAKLAEMESETATVQESSDMDKLDLLLESSKDIQLSPEELAFLEEDKKLNTHA